MIYLPHLIPRLLKFGLLALLAVILAFTAFLGYLAMARNQPLVLPAPNGQYPAGRVEINWTDASRPDPLANQDHFPRKLVIWIWYPAANQGNTPAPYLPPAWVTVRDLDQGIGLLAESNFSRIQTHSFDDVPLAVAPQAFPVLVMAPGMGPIATDYTVMTENLASHGYVVVAINPTGTANWTVFLDGLAAPRTRKGAIPDSDTLKAEITFEKH